VPIATVGYIQRDLVERHEWVDRGDFLDGVALGQTMPGPLAAQVVMWIGYLRRGILGPWGRPWRSSSPRSSPS
jgi:chromate transporter